MTFPKLGLSFLKIRLTFTKPRLSFLSYEGLCPIVVHIADTKSDAKNGHRYDFKPMVLRQQVSPPELPFLSKSYTYIVINTIKFDPPNYFKKFSLSHIVNSS